MTMQELWSKCLPGVMNQNEIGLKIVSGKRIVVEIIGWLHRLVSREINSLLLASEPLCPPNNVAHIISEYNDILFHHKVIPTCVFDGSQCPMKSKTNAERKLTRRKAEK